MDSKAIKLIDMVLKHESGYANVSGDMGGETYRGITRKNFPSWSGWKIVDENKPLKNGKIIKNAELENDVREFYYSNFYLPMKIGKIDDLLISGHVFCHGVNAGIKNAIKLLQKAINQTYSVDIAVDGIIGNDTLKYANGDKQSELSQNLIEQRNNYYKNLVAKRPSQKKFLNGWLNRVKNTTKACSGTSMFLTSLGGDKMSIISKILKFIFDIFLFFLKNKKS